MEYFYRMYLDEIYEIFCLDNDKNNYIVNDLLNYFLVKMVLNKDLDLNLYNCLNMHYLSYYY